MKTCDNVPQLAPELGVRRKWLYVRKERTPAGDPEQARLGYRPPEELEPLPRTETPPAAALEFPEP